MRKIHTVLRLHFESGLSRRAIAKSQSISYGTVANYLHRAHSAGLNWPLPEAMGEHELTAALFPERAPDNTHKRFTEPDYPRIHLELKSVGMTKQLAWEEYRQIHPDDGYSYSQFCHRYLLWLQRQQRSMRQTHVAGEKVFVDYCGPTVPIVNPDTGDCSFAQIFVAALGASNYTFACATLSQREADWIEAHTKAAEFFGGWAQLTIPDNLKSGVAKPHRYIPVLNASYEQWADHYATAIIPARPYKPKDKAKVENAVLVVERWILAKLRHYTFFSLGQLNAAIADLLVDLNNRPFKKLPGTRRSLYEKIEQQALQPLPRQRYEYQHVRLARVHIDYHIEYDKHYYSVPHMLVKAQVEVRATSHLVSIYAAGKRVACHTRSTVQAGHSTLKEHMPRSHQKQTEWTPERLEQWAADIGNATLQVVRIQFSKKQHPEQAYRQVFPLLSLSKQYDRVRLEKACQRALEIGSPTRTSVQSILKNGIDNLPSEKQQELFDDDEHLNHHDNVRGADYFH
jgi:transposase